MTEKLRYPKSWSLTLLESELRDAAASPPLSLARMRILRWLAEMKPDEADILWGRAYGLSWAALAAERTDANDSSIAHRLYMPALEHLRTIATLDTFDHAVALCGSAMADASNRLDQEFEKVEAAIFDVNEAA